MLMIQRKKLYLWNLAKLSSYKPSFDGNNMVCVVILDLFQIMYFPNMEVDTKLLVV